MAFRPGDDRVTWRQTQTSATHGQQVACSGAPLTGDTGNDIQLVEGGTPGSSPINVQVAAGATEAALFMETDSFGLTRWEGGTWVINMEITQGNGDMRWQEIYVCRLNSGGVNQGTVTFRTGINQDIDDGPVSLVLNQNSSVAVSSTDLVLLVFVIQNVEATPQSFEFEPNGYVVSPYRRVRRVSARANRDFSSRQRMISTAQASGLPPTVNTTLTVSAPNATAQAVTLTQVRSRGGSFFKI